MAQRTKFEKTKKILEPINLHRSYKTGKIDYNQKDT